MKRWAVRATKILLSVVLAVAVLVGAAVVATQTSWFRDWARGFGERQAARLLNGELSIGRLEGNLWTGATLTDVRITQDGREVVRIDRVHVEYNPRQLLRRDFLFPEITLTRPVIVLIHDAAGWHIANLLRPRQNTGNAQPVRLPNIIVEQGTFTIEDRVAGDGMRWPAQIQGFDAALGLVLSRGLIDLSIERSTFTTAQPDLAVASLAGHWIAQNGAHQVSDLQLRTARSVIDGSFSFRPATGGAARGSISLNTAIMPIDLQEFAGIVPALAGRDLVLSGSADVQGPLDALAIKTNLADARAGGVRADVVLTTAGEARTIRGTAVTDRLDLAPILKDSAFASRLTSSDRLDLTFTGPWSFDTLSGTATTQSTDSTIWGYRWSSLNGTARIARRTLAVNGSVRAYGTSATATGTITPAGGPVRYALQGRLTNVDVRQLPPQLPLPDLESQISGDYKVSGTGARLDASATFDASTIEGAEIGAGSTGRFSNLDGTLRYGFAGHVAHADVQRFGRVLDIASITGDDFASSFTGDVMVDGSGNSVATLALDASAQLEPSTAFRGTLGPAAVTARIADKTLTASYNGTVSDFDAERVTGRQDLSGKVGGMVELQGTVVALDQPFDLGAVTARGTVTLDPSTIGPLAIDSARLDASLMDRLATITTFEAMGPRLVASASGTVALGDDRQSDLKYSVSMTRLADIGPLVGRTLDGRVLVDGTVKGNRADLSSSGTAVFSGLKVDDSFDALTLSSSFDAKLPNLDVHAMTATVKAESTLVTLSGRAIPSLTATVNYAQDRYRFEATANETGRTITVGGDLALLEGGREVTVDRLALVAGESTWALAADGPVIFRYDPSGLITLPREVTLVNNGQLLTAQGSLALNEQTNGSMDVTVSGVDLTALGSLLLVNRQLAGTLTGDARIVGNTVTRNIVGNVKVLSGVVDGYAFQSFDALVDYRSEVARVDGILIQSPTSKLEATGVIPFALNRGVLTDRPLTVDITSAGIDLAALEAANIGLVNATGLLVVDVHVTGTGTAPVANGTVKVQQGAFTVAATGVDYKDVTVDATLQGDEVQIARMSLHDNDGDALQGSGRLKLENRAFRDIEFVITGNDVTVLDNELGRASVDATLNLYGTITAPKVAGLVRLHSGRIEVDQVLDRFGSSPYEPVRPAATADAATPSDAAQPIALNLTVQVPDNLVLRGRDLRTGNTAVGLGDVNLTAGGDFTLVREGPGGPVLVGTITTVRGTYDFQGRRFQVLRDGSITFRGERPIDPALNVTAERVISGVVAHVMVSGTMRDPELTLSSQPPLDQGDILSLIVFNQPVNRLGQGQAANLGERAAQMAGGFVVSPIADTLGRALNVDVFEVDPSGDEGDGPSVTVGQQVGERLFVKFRQIFGARDASEFQLEYQLADFLRLQGSIAEGQSSANRSLTRRVERGGIDLVVYFSY